MPGYEAGRIRAIFELPCHLSYLSKEKLVYIEHFRPFSKSNPMPHGLYSTTHTMTSGVRKTSVILLSLIRMACHLTLRYQQISETLHISSETDLLSVAHQFYFNNYASHFVFLVLEYWRKHGGNGASPLCIFF
jgi:hypothetical protein